MGTYTYFSQKKKKQSQHQICAQILLVRKWVVKSRGTGSSLYSPVWWIEVTSVLLLAWGDTSSATDHGCRIQRSQQQHKKSGNTDENTSVSWPFPGTARFSNGNCNMRFFFFSFPPMLATASAELSGEVSGLSAGSNKQYTELNLPGLIEVSSSSFLKTNSSKSLGFFLLLLLAIILGSFHVPGRKSFAMRLKIFWCRCHWSPIRRSCSAHSLTASRSVK